MAARIVRLTAALVAAALMLILLVAFGRRGEDPERGLDGFRRYLPGNTVPGDVECRSLNEYPGASGEMCTLDFTPRSGARTPQKPLARIVAPAPCAVSGWTKV